MQDNCINFFKTCKYLSSWDPGDINCHFPSKIVVTCFIQQGDKILILQRARKDLQYKLWGIPGGKLDKGESPLTGLIRDLKEELNLDFSPRNFKLLGITRSKTVSDGDYGLYLYYMQIPENLKISINYEEHLSFEWVYLEEFEKYDLLLAQKEAYRFVEKKLKNIYKVNTLKLQG